MNQIRNYVFIPSGEAIRGLEITIATAIVNAVYKTDFTQLGNWKAWVTGIGLAALVEAVAFIKGKLPPVTPPPINPTLPPVNPSDGGKA